MQNKHSGVNTLLQGQPVGAGFSREQYEQYEQCEYFWRTFARTMVTKSLAYITANIGGKHSGVNTLQQTFGRKHPATGAAVGAGFSREHYSGMTVQKPMY